MSKHRTKRTAGEDRHVRLYYWIMDTPAWSALGAIARATLIEVKRRYNGSNNGRIPLSVREVATALHIGKSTVARAFADLEQKGFLVPEQKSKFDWKVSNGKPSGRSTRWRLTEHPCDITGEMATKDFARWLPGYPQAGHSKQNPVPSQTQNGLVTGHGVITAGHLPQADPESGHEGGHFPAKTTKSELVAGQYIINQVGTPALPTLHSRSDDPPTPTQGESQ